MKCLYLSTWLDRHRSRTIESRMNEEARMRRLPYMAHETNPGAHAITDESTSSQLTADLCDLNLVVRKKGDPTRAAGGEPGKNRRAPRRSNEPESVCRSADRIKTPWIIHRRDRTRGPTTGSLPVCLRCASSARLPFSFNETWSDGESKFTRYIFDDYILKNILNYILKKMYKLRFRVMIKIIIPKRWMEDPTSQFNIFVYN